VGAIFIWLSGASRKILRECPTERPKYYGLGALIAVTGAMAGVSLAFALVSGLKISLRDAIIFAVLWGLAVMMIDRFFVVSMHRQSNPLIYLVQALPRLAMAVVLGFVISTPFVLQIFKPEITNQLALTQAAQRTAYYNSLSHDPLALTVQQDENNVNTLTADAASGGPGINISADPTLRNLQGQLTSAKNQLAYWTNELNCQLYGGTTGGITCHPGYGPVGQNDQEQVKTWQGQVDTLDGEVKARTNLLQTQSTEQQNREKATAQGQLTTAGQKLNTDQNLLTLQTQDRTNGIKGDSGILAQLKALSAVTAGNSTLQAARLLLFLLFFIVDILPVFSKLLLNLMPPSTYDKILAEEEMSQAQAAEDTRAVRRAAHRAATQSEAAGVRQRNAAWTAPLSGQHDDIVDMRQRVHKAWLKRREADLLRDIANGQGLVGSGSTPNFDGWHPSWPQGQPGGFRPRWPWNGGASHEEPGWSGSPQPRRDAGWRENASQAIAERVRAWLRRLQSLLPGSEQQSPLGEPPMAQPGYRVEPGQQPPVSPPWQRAEPAADGSASTGPVPGVSPLPPTLNGGPYRPEPSAGGMPVPDASPGPDPLEPGYVPGGAGMPLFPPAPDPADEQTYPLVLDQPAPESPEPPEGPDSPSGDG
jgi:Domain of unknown function (DUF4407)